MGNWGVLLCTGNSGSIDGVNDEGFSDEIALVCTVKGEEWICLVKGEWIRGNVAVFPSQITELQKGQSQVQRERSPIPGTSLELRDCKVAILQRCQDQSVARRQGRSYLFPELRNCGL